MELFYGIGAALGILAFIGVMAQNVMSNRDVERIWRNIVSNTSIWSERYWTLKVKSTEQAAKVEALAAAASSQAKVNEIWLRHLSDHTFAVVTPAPKVKRVSRRKRGKR